MLTGQEKTAEGPGPSALASTLPVNKGPLCNLNLLLHDMETDPIVKGDTLEKIPALQSGLVT